MHNLLKCPLCGFLFKFGDLCFFSCGHHICRSCFKNLTGGNPGVAQKLSCCFCKRNDVHITTAIPDAAKARFNFAIDVIRYCSESWAVAEGPESAKYLWLKTKMKSVREFRECCKCCRPFGNEDRKFPSQIGDVCLSCSISINTWGATPFVVIFALEHLVKLVSSNLTPAEAFGLCLDHKHVLQFECLTHDCQAVCEMCLHVNSNHHGCSSRLVTPQLKKAEFKTKWAPLSEDVIKEVSRTISECDWKEKYVGGRSDLKHSSTRLLQMLQLLKDIGGSLSDEGDPDWIVLSGLFKKWQTEEYAELQPSVQMHKGSYFALRECERNALEVMEVDSLPADANKHS